MCRIEENIEYDEFGVIKITSNELNFRKKDNEYGTQILLNIEEDLRWNKENEEWEIRGWESIEIQISNRDHVVDLINRFLDPPT